ncbi:MAG TPA: hypothetical protein VG308_14800 [Stellaceae bacterium]|nr:hypothetical protein [Stellaceae bacterium]
MRATALGFGTMMLCSTAGVALACQSHASPIFEDNFKNADAGWGQPDNVAAFTPQGLVLTPPVSGSAWRSNGNYSMAHADWCVTVVNPATLADPPDEDTVGAVGLWFWSRDQQNFYTASITLDGNASVDRLNHGIWQTVVPPTAAPAIKTGPGATNEIELVTSGNTASFYVNGSLITKLTAKPPANGGSPGVYGESGPKGTSWLFTHVALY